jgi:hypothetical protein
MRGYRIVALGLVLMLTACASAPPPPSRSAVSLLKVAARHVHGLPTQPYASAFAPEVYLVTSLAEMVELSDLVIVGTAIAIAPGRSAGEEVTARLQWRDVAVEVAQVLYGDYYEITLTVEEFGWMDGVPATINWSSWARLGDRMLLGLKGSSNGEGIGGERFVLTSTATRFYLRASGDVAHNYVRDSEASQFALDTAAMSVDELLSRVGFPPAPRSTPPSSRVSRPAEGCGGAGDCR